jgi:hypothetical protein
MLVLPIHSLPGTDNCDQGILGLVVPKPRGSYPNMTAWLTVRKNWVDFSRCNLVVNQDEDSC